MRSIFEPSDVCSLSIVPFGRDVPLRAMLSAAGHEDRQPPERYDWHGLERGDAEFGLIQITLEGEGRLRCGGVERRLTPGDAMALTFPHDHRYWRPRQRHWRFIYACLHGREAMRLWREAIRMAGPVWVVRPESALTQVLAQIVRRAAHGAMRDPWEASRWAYTLATHGAATALEVRRGRAVGDAEPAVKRAIAYADAHFREDIGVAELANAAGLSRYHFSRVFQQSVGQPPGDYLRQRRLNFAVEQIQSTSQSLKVIARTAGFSSESYLSKVIRKAYGIPPREVRRRGLYSPLNTA